MQLSKSQIDKLGERFSKGIATSDDLLVLDRYRRSFMEQYEHVVGRLRAQAEVQPTGRPAKSTSSIIEKLRRESIRLSQIQDVAGCRVLVDDFAAQEMLVAKFKDLFQAVSVVDRRVVSSHGYRAVHVIVRHKGMPIEIQVRTKLQHSWAELSERLADEFDPALKYGGGPHDLRHVLDQFSGLCATIETTEQQLYELNQSKRSITDQMELGSSNRTIHIEQLQAMDLEIAKLYQIVRLWKQSVTALITPLISNPAQLREENE